jgi:ankyrin repeat protein
MDCARLLLERGAPVDGADSTTPLSIAARQGHTAMCRLLIEHGADVQGGKPPAPERAPTEIPLLEAAGSGHVETVQALLDLGASVNARDSHGRTALHQAAIEFRPEVAKVLLERGADPALEDDFGLTPAFTSLWFYGDPEVAQVLIDGGAPWTIHLAAGMGRLDRLREFLDQGVGVNTASKAIDADGWTPLHWAAHCGQPEAAEFLLQRGAKVDARNTNADTPLLLAAAYASHEVAAVLLAHGADSNALGSEGHPALSSAAARNYVEMAELLLDHGAKLDLKDSCGETPLTCAQKWGGIEMERLLKSRGAK